MKEKRNKDIFQKKFLHVSGLPYSIVTLLCQIGSRNDPKGREGLVHAIEHLLSTFDTETQKKRMHFLEKNGIVFEAMTTKEYVALTYIQPKEKTKLSVQQLLNDVGNARFNEQCLEREKKAILHELQEEKSDVDKALFNGCLEGLWPSSDLSHPIAGSTSSVKRISLNEISSFYKNQFLEADKTLLVIGDTDISQNTKNVLENQTLKIKKQPRVFKNTQPILFQDSISFGNRIRFGIYFRSVPASKREERAVLSIIADCFAGLWSSQLNQILRFQKNFTYWVNQYTEYFSDAGILGFEFTVQSKDALPALQASFEQIEKFLNKSISQSTLNAIIQTRISDIARDGHNPQALIQWYIDESLYTDSNTTFDEYIKLLKSITPSRVREIANMYLKPENRTIVVVGTSNKSLRRKINTLIETM